MNETELILRAVRGDWQASLELLDIHHRRLVLNAPEEPIADPDPEC